MLGTIARLALLRVMPRKLVPLLAAWQVLQVVRGRRRPDARTRAELRTDDEARRTRPR
jgi:hypothetical protein